MRAEDVDKQVLAQLPPQRMKAGVKTHNAVYKKIKAYTNLGALLKFVGIEHPCPAKAKFNTFFEVSLGCRIADFILLVSCGQKKMCYVVELKTCMGAEVNMLSDVRQSQRSVGLGQLSDSVRYIQQRAPPGRQTWEILPFLVFKSQQTLKSVHIESLPVPANLLQTSRDKFISFLSQREDVFIKKKLLQVEVGKQVLSESNLLEPTPTKRTSARLQLLNRNKKKCFQRQAQVCSKYHLRSKTAAAAKRAGRAGRRK